MSNEGISKSNLAWLMREEKEELYKQLNSCKGEKSREFLMPQTTFYAEDAATSDQYSYTSNDIPMEETPFEIKEGCLSPDNMSETPFEIKQEDLCPHDVSETPFEVKEEYLSPDNGSDGTLANECCCYSQLLDKIEGLKSTVEWQTQILATAVTANTAMLKRLLGEETVNSELIGTFPIKTDADLLQINESIDKENENQYVSEITRIIKFRGIVKMFDRIVSPNVILLYNYEGKKNKKCFKDLKNINEVIQKAYEMEDKDGDFSNAMRKAFKASKNRHFKNVHMQNKKFGIKPQTVGLFKS